MGTISMHQKQFPFRLFQFYELQFKIGQWRVSQSLNRMQNEQETMTEDVIEVTKPVSKWKLRFMGAIAMGSGLIAVVSAGTIK